MPFDRRENLTDLESKRHERVRFYHQNALQGHLLILLFVIFIIDMIYFYHYFMCSCGCGLSTFIKLLSDLIWSDVIWSDQNVDDECQWIQIHTHGWWSQQLLTRLRYVTIARLSRFQFSPLSYFRVVSASRKRRGNFDLFSLVANVKISVKLKIRYVWAENEPARSVWTNEMEKNAQRRRKQCALAVVRRSQKFRPRHRLPSRGRGTAKI